MKQTSISLTDDQFILLDQISKFTGNSVGATIRTAIMKYALENYEDIVTNLERYEKLDGAGQYVYLLDKS